MIGQTGDNWPGVCRLTGNGVTVGDVLGCLRCGACFAPLLLAPGYCLAWVADLAGFRSRGVGERLAWAVALSFATTPIVAVELAKYGSLTAVCWLGAACSAGLLGLAVAEFRAGGLRVRSRWGAIAGAVAAAWVVLAIAELVDVGAGHRLYLSVTVFDHALRSAFVDAVGRTGVPPANPLYWPGHAAAMRYYYFWYVLTAAAARLAGATAHQGMIASVVWAGFGLAAVLALYCRHFLPARGEGSPACPRLGMALALLAVTGLDILPVAAKALLRLPTDADMEWWSSDQVASWMDSLLWVPHHIVGLLSCLFGFLLVWLSKAQSPRRKTLSAVLAGAAFASAFGLSTWVALASALVLLAWLVWVVAFERDSRPRLAVLLVAALVASIALVPYLRELRAEPSDAAGGSIAGSAQHLLRFGVRRVIDPEGLLALPWFAGSGPGDRPVAGLVGLAIRLLLLVPGYFVELGFFGLVLVAAVSAARRRRLGESLRTAVFLTIATLAVTTFVRSTVIGNNDFGWRSALIAQFFLLLLAVAWWEGALGATSRGLRVAAMAMLWIGLAGTVYQAVGLRLYLPLEEALGRPEQAGLEERAMALRLASDAMEQRVPPGAVIQFNTGQPSDFFRFAQVMHAGRQIASAFPGCAAEFGGSPAACPAIRAGVAEIFEPSAGRAISASEARAVCRRLGIGDLVATRWDGVWFDRQGWVWTLPSAVDTGEVRVLDCSGG